MGHPAAPLSQRIRAALESAGRPLSRSEITGWFVANRPVGDVQAELDRMVAAGELEDAGLEPRPASDPFPERGPWRLYGLKPGRRGADNTPGQSRPGGDGR